MNVRDAAQELLKTLGAPTWAVSIAATVLEGQASLVVRVDPNYRQPLDIPPSFRGFPVSMQWRQPFRAQA